MTEELLQTFQTIQKYIPENGYHTGKNCSCDKENCFFKELKAKGVEVSNCFFDCVFLFEKEREKHRERKYLYASKFIFINKETQRIVVGVDELQTYLQCDDIILGKLFRHAQYLLNQDTFVKFVLNFLFDQNYVMLLIEQYEVNHAETVGNIIEKCLN